MTRSYFNSKADIWDEKIAEKDIGKLANMAERLDIQPGSALLDVGTGTGVFVPFLLKKLGNSGKLVCLDFAEKMLEKAKAKNFRGDIDYVCADITSTELDNQVFNSVVCYSSFPHFPDKPQALREINRLLKKGGKVYICHTSSRLAINGIHQKIPGFSADLVPEKEDMLGLFSLAGFGQVEIIDEVDSYLAKAEKV
jgi:ubiquinone/menaquinone biosynthesis C-methylase UbiE